MSKNVLEGIIDWSKAPDWANWAAQDGDGTITFFTKEPYVPIGGDYWIQGERLPFQTLSGTPHEDWKNSLMKRPKSEVKPKFPVNWGEIPEEVKWVRISENHRVIVGLSEKDDVGDEWTWHERPAGLKPKRPTNDHAEIPVWIYRLNDGGFIVKEEPVTEIDTLTLFARKFIDVSEGEGL